MINFGSFGDELTKIAEQSDQGQSRRFNKEVAKQMLGNAAMIAGGTAVGYGGAELARMGLKRFAGPRSSKIRQGIAYTLPTLGGLAVMGYKRKLDAERDRLLEEAYQRGVAKGQRDV